MSLSGAKFSKIAVLGGGVSSKDKKTWKVKVAKQFKKMGGSGQQAEKGDKSSAQAQSYPEGGSIGVPVSLHRIVQQHKSLLGICLKVSVGKNAL